MKAKAKTRNSERYGGPMNLCRFFLVFALCMPGVLHAQQTQQSGNPPRDNSKYVVFIHAGGKDIGNQIGEITIALLKERYIVRAPDKDQDKIGGPGVDYFDDSAFEAAQDVAKIVNGILQNLKLQDEGKTLKPRAQRLKNPAGYLGVWLF